MKILINVFNSASSETRRRENNGPLKLEVQVQPSVVPKPYPLRIDPNSNVQFISPTSSPLPDPFETIKPQIDPALAASIYQQHQINLHPTYNPLRDPNIIDPQVVNALLQQQYFASQSPFRQNVDNSVSTYTTPQNRPPFFNWFGTNNNNYQSDQQQGPILGFLTNLAQNNPLTSFFNSLQNDQTQNQNPFQSFLSNLNPLNLFNNNNNNRPMQSLPIQADYISTMAPTNAFLSNNIDSSVFSNDHFLNPTQIPHNPNFNNGYLNQNYNQNFNNHYQGVAQNPYLNQFSTTNRPIQSVNFNPSVGQVTPIYNPNYNQQLSSAGNVQPYSQLFLQNPSSFPIYQNPYQAISPVTLSSNYNRKKINTKTSKKKNNKNKVDVPETDSDWFQDFLDKRKEASLDLTSKRTTKKSSDEDDDFDDYFR